MTDRQSIDLICTKVLGWHKHWWNKEKAPDIWEWRDNTEKASNNRIGDFMADSSFDPFTSPADCARVMEEVKTKGCGYEVIWDRPAEEYKAHIFTPRQIEVNPSVRRGYSRDSWAEAFCNALIETMKGER